MAGPKTRFYVNKRRKMISGVCAGFADYYGMDVTWVRLIALAGLCTLGPFAVIAYMVASKSATERSPELEREVARQDRDEKEFWKKVRRNPRATARSIRARFRDLDRRMAASEAYLTSPDKRLEREIERLR